MTKVYVVEIEDWAFGAFTTLEDAKNAILDYAKEEDVSITFGEPDTWESIPVYVNWNTNIEGVNDVAMYYIMMYPLNELQHN